MIVEITPELLVEMFRNDNVIHSVVVNGISRDHYLAETRVNRHGNIELVCVTSDEDQSLEVQPVMLTDLRGT